MYRPEYPRPQMPRPDWINLNGASWGYDHRAKFDPAIFHATLSQKAAIEEE